jgi:ATP-dependent helicase/nuclease subunit A
VAKSRPLPVDQKERERAGNDLDHSYCVEAAAGTGKTSLLLSRILSIVASGRAELEQVAAITFTEKATAELKIRLREELEKALVTSSGGQLKRFELGLEQLDRANISTIHSFASSLLRERPVEAGVDPGFEQLDEMGSDLLFDDTWQEWKEKQLEKGPRILRRLLSLEINLDKSLKPVARKLFENRDIALAMATPPVQFDLETAWNGLERRVSELVKLASTCTNTADAGYLQIQKLKTLLALCVEGDPLDRERTIYLDLDIKTAGNQKNWKPVDSCKRQKELCQQLKDWVDEAREHIGVSVAAAILDWLKDFLHEVEREKQARGVLDFQDLLLKARDLVRDHLEVRGYFQRRFRYLLVDEFQDTDPLQAELIFFLSEGEPRAARWFEVQPASGKLFLVGDPKQSIYRFRRADIEIYKQAKQVLERSGQGLVIRQNFRSSGSVIRAVNDLFAPQMNETQPYQANYVPLVEQPGRPEPGSGLVLLFPKEDYAPGSMEVYRETEAELIARFAIKACQEYQVWDRAKDDLRPASYRDLAILFPVTTGITHYEESLDRAGIPYQFDAGRQFYERRETRALISVLRAVDNPEDAVAVVAALRSPFFGLSDEDLFLYRQAGGRFHYLQDRPQGFERVGSSLEQLRNWHDTRSRLSIPALVECVLDESHIMPFHLLLPNGEQAVANLLRVVELGRAFEVQRAASLRGFVRWLEQREASELAEAEALLAEEKDNAAQLLTVHAAKGLEFPIVVLANFGCGSRAQNSFMVDHSQQMVSLSIGPTEKQLHTSQYAGMASNEGARAAAEDLRLLYVAATRAKDFLAIPLVEPGKTDHSRFLQYFEPLRRQALRPPQAIQNKGSMLLPADALPELGSERTALRKNLGNTPISLAQAAPVLAEREAWGAGLQQLGVKTAVAPSAEPEKSWGLGADAVPSRRGAKAQAIGTAFHRIMQQLELHGDPLLDRLIKEISVSEGIPEEIQLLENLVKQTLLHRLLQRAQKARRVWRELPFSISVNGDVREGYIDLLFEEADGLVLVDYKTDDVDPKELDRVVDTYRQQAGIYRDAVHQITRHIPREVSLLFVRRGIAREV